MTKRGACLSRELRGHKASPARMRAANKKCAKHTKAGRSRRGRRHRSRR